MCEFAGSKSAKLVVSEYGKLVARILQSIACLTRVQIYNKSSHVALCFAVFHSIIIYFIYLSTVSHVICILSVTCLPWHCFRQDNSLSVLSPDIVPSQTLSDDHSLTGLPWHFFIHVHSLSQVSSDTASLKLILCHWYLSRSLYHWSLLTLFPLLPLFVTGSTLSCFSQDHFLSLHGNPWSSLLRDHPLSVTSPVLASFTAILCHWYPLILLPTRSHLSLVSPDPASHTFIFVTGTPDPASHTLIFFTGIPWSYFPHDHSLSCTGTPDPASHMIIFVTGIPLILLPTWSLFVMHWYPLTLLPTRSYLSLVSPDPASHMITLCHALVSPDPTFHLIIFVTDFPWPCLSHDHSLSLVPPDPTFHSIIFVTDFPDPAYHTIIFVTGIPWSCFPHDHSMSCTGIPWSCFPHDHICHWYPLILRITWSLFVTCTPWSCWSYDHSLSLVPPDPAYHMISRCHWYPLILLITRSLFVTGIPWYCFH
jgi:hypothetical protein